MIRKSDIQWWTQEARKNPESATAIIEELAARIIELDREVERLRNELIRAKRGSLPKAHDDSKIGKLEQRVDTLQSILKGQASTEPAVLLLSEQLQAVRLPLSQIRLQLRRDKAMLDRTTILSLCQMVVARAQDDLVLLTNQARVLRVYLHKIPFPIENQSWQAIRGVELESGERVTAGAALTQAPRFWTVVTRRGYVRQFLHARLEKIVQGGQAVIASEFKNDNPVALVNGDKGDLLIVTRWGKAVRFPQHTIMGTGAVALNVEKDDEVAAAIQIDQDREIVILTSAGFAMRRDSSTFKRQNKPGGAGRSIIQAFDVINAFPYEERGKLLLLSYSGKFTAVPPANIPLQTRLGKGSEIMKMSADPAVAATFVPGVLL